MCARWWSRLFLMAVMLVRGPSNKELFVFIQFVWVCLCVAKDNVMPRGRKPDECDSSWCWNVGIFQDPKKNKTMWLHCLDFISVQTNRHAETPQKHRPSAVHTLPCKKFGIFPPFLSSERKHLLRSENMPTNHLFLASLSSWHLLFGV